MRGETRRIAERALLALLGLGLGWGGLAPPVDAQEPLTRQEVPRPLAPWVDWALDGLSEYGCTLVGEERRCVWPGALELELDTDGGRFEQRVVTDRETEVPLPGDRACFPHDVEVDGRAAAVLERTSDTGEPVPYLRIPAGAHEITGTLRWKAMPELLRVPPTVARVSLVLDGEPVPSPRRNEEGMLWLRKRAGGEDDQESHLELEAHRRLEDGIPFRVTTRLTVRASGRPREMELGQPALPGMTPVQVSSELAVRIEADGTLVAQVHAGSHTIEVVALVASPPKSLSPPEQQAPWPASEVWVWAADEAFRQVEVSGAPSIDPQRTSLPEPWRDAPAYVLEPARTLKLETTRRGEPTPPPNRLQLHRELWLDLDGNGYTVRDRIDGRMSRDWRLDLEEGDLGHVVVGGEDRLITRHDDRAGVELREGELDLRAEWRLGGGARELPAVAWSEDVQQLDASVHLPPGWSLLAVSGADRAPGTWLDQWNLWAIFFVLVVSLALGRLVGWHWGIIALVTLALTYHESGAPLAAWAALIAFLALARVLPEGHVARGARVLFWIAAIVLVVVSVPFAAEQIRTGLYPETADLGGGGFSLATRDVKGAAEAPPAPVEPAPQQQGLTEGEEKAEAVGGEPADEDAVPSAPLEASDQRARRARAKPGADAPKKLDLLRSTGKSKGPDWIDPNAVIQTGPGVPTWSFRQQRLSWSGPVERGHTLHLWLVPPSINRLLSLLRVLLLGALVVVVIMRRPRPRRRDGGAGGAAAAAGALLLAALLGAPSPATAQPIPTDAQLQELRSRLARKPGCAPGCVLASDMTVQLEQGRVAIGATVHAGAAAAFRVPGPADGWVPSEVRVDGSSSDGLALLGDDFLFLRLEPGRHRVELEGPLRNPDTLTLAFGEPPRRLQVRAPGWDVEGVREDGQPSESIQLRRRIRAAEEEGAEGEAMQLPEWLIVHRRLQIGVRWTMSTVVERVTPPGTPVVVRIPLLEGESVTESAVQTEDGTVVVSLGRDAERISWTSVLEPRDALELTAAEDVRWSERWRLACSPIWHCDPQGLAPVSHEQNGRWEPEYVPFPGESLEVAFARPEAAEGRSTTIDRAELVLRPGVRMAKATLDMTVRASSGGAQQITLPDGARVQSLTVDGQDRPVQQEGDTLRVTVQPGSQELQVTWQQPSGIEMALKAPKVDLGAEAVNARVRIEMPRDRWLLWADGPDWGVAIVFWPYLLLVLAVAVILARTRRTPLGIVQWALLGLGLTQIPSWAALLVVGWFFAVEQRRRRTEIHPAWFDLRQLALAFYTLVALGCLYAAVHSGLLMQPDMQVMGLGSDTSLAWYADRVDGVMPRPSVFSVPLWTWRIAMLAWALWLAWRLVRWAPWFWRAMSEGGLWRRITTRPPAPAGGAGTRQPPPTGAGQPPQQPAEPSASAPAEPAEPSSEQPDGESARPAPDEEQS